MDQLAQNFIFFIDNFKDPYNRFVKHYNDASNKISAVAELATNREIINQDINKIHSKINHWVDKLCEHILFQKIHDDHQSELIIERDNLIKRLKNSIDYRSLAMNTEEILEQETVSIRDFYEFAVIEPDPDPIDLQEPITIPMIKKLVETPIAPGGLKGALSGINTISTLGKEVRRKQAMLSAIEDVIETVIDKCYPGNSPLELWQNLSEEQQYEAANDFARDLQRKKERNKPIRDKIIDTAASIIQKNGKVLDDYLTLKGHANSKLYKHPKIRNFDNGNARRWINEAIKTGEL